jgi:hypothetical protein
MSRQSKTGELAGRKSKGTIFDFQLSTVDFLSGTVECA